MPPAISERLLQSVTGLFSGRSQGRERGDDSGSARADGNPQPPSSSNSSVHSSTLQSRPHVGLGKRGEFDGMTERSDRNIKRVRQTGDHEKRLTGDYSVAPDAKKISMPLPERNDERPPQTPVKMPRGANNRAFRHMNTLDQPYGSRNAVRPSISDHSRLARPREIEMAEDSPPAREQIDEMSETGAGFFSSPGHPIDLTTEDHGIHSRPMTARLDIGTRPTSKASQYSQRSNASEASPRNRDYFGNPEYHKTDSFIGGRIGKSHNPALIECTPPMACPRYGQNREELHGSSPPFTRNTRSRANFPASSEHATVSPTGHSPPPIALTKNLPPKAAQFQRNDKGNPGSPRRRQHKQSPGHFTSPDGRPLRSPVIQERQEVSRFYANAHNGPDFSTKVVFSRLDEPANRPKAKDRMRASSSTYQDPHSRLGMSMGSEDELSGATTITSDMLSFTEPGSRAVNPHRMSERPLPHTHLLQSHTQRTRPNKTKCPSKDDHNYFAVKRPASDDPENSRCQVSCLYSQCCILERDKIELVWDANRRVLTVECEGEVQMVPGDERPFQIDKSTATHAWIECGTTRQVWLKGSKSSFGNGNTLIEYKTKEDMAFTFSCLMVMLNDNLKVGQMDADKMASVFEKQGSELRDAFEKKKMKIPTSRSTARLSPMPRTGRQRSGHMDDDEQIKYDSPSRSISHSPPFKHPARGVSYDDQRRSSRRPQRTTQQKPRSPTPEKWSRTHNPTPWSLPVTYPTTGVRRVTVDFQDLERLDEGECLNDNIVDFALRQIEEGMDSEHRRDVHFFNSFFFSALSTKNGRKDFNYDAVKRWTRTTDLFTIPYIVVPINAEFHWFVAIICNLPALQRRISGLTDEPRHEERLHPAEESSDPPHHEVEKIISSYDGQNLPSLPVKSKYFPSSLVLNVKVGAPKVVSSTDASMTPGQPEQPSSQTYTKGSGRVKKKPVGRKYSPDDPVIMTLDSLGSTRGPEIRYLKHYIKAEAMDKRNMDVEMTQLLGITAKGVPEQSNFTDCGLYLIGYLEEFAKDPRKFVTKILSRQMEETEFEDFKPSVKRSNIRDTLIGLHKQQDDARKAHKKEKRDAKRRAQQPAEGHPHIEVSLSEAQREHAADQQLLASSEHDDSSKTSKLVPDVSHTNEARAASYPNAVQMKEPAASSADDLGKADIAASDASDESWKGITSKPRIDNHGSASSVVPNSQTTSEVRTDVEPAVFNNVADQAVGGPVAECYSRLTRASDDHRLGVNLDMSEQAEKILQESAMLSPVADQSTQHTGSEHQVEQPPEIPDSQEPHGLSQVEVPDSQEHHVTSHVKVIDLEHLEF